MHNFRLTFALVLGLLSGAFTFGTAQAATVNVVTDLTPALKTVHGVRANTSTSLLDLVGMLITVNYADGAREDLVWEDLGSWRGGIRGGGIGLNYVNWGLSLSTDTRISSIGLNLAPANAFFDTLSLSEGSVGNTPGSKNGSPFRITGGDVADSDSVQVNFSSLLFLAGHLPGIDAFTNLLIDFSGVSGGGLLGRFSFAVDTDSLAVPGDLTPVPLPNSLLLLLAAVAGLTMLRFKTGGKAKAVTGPVAA